MFSHAGHIPASSRTSAEEFAAILLHRFAPSLNAHQQAAVWLSHEPEITTARFLEYLNTHNLVSNVAV
jgi:hypothetical protein